MAIMTPISGQDPTNTETQRQKNLLGVFASPTSPTASPTSPTIPSSSSSANASSKTDISLLDSFLYRKTEPVSTPNIQQSINVNPSLQQPVQEATDDGVLFPFQKQFEDFKAAKNRPQPVQQSGQNGQSGQSLIEQIGSAQQQGRQQGKTTEDILRETGRQDLINTLSSRNMRADEIKSAEPLYSNLQPTQTEPVQSQRDTNIQGGLNIESQYPQGKQFLASDGVRGLGGQCLWFAQQITKTKDGDYWTVGNSAQQKTNNIYKHRKSGDAFLVGEKQIQPGNTLIFNNGIYGHAAVVKEVLPDGRLRLTESNYGNDLRVTHDRVIDPNNSNSLVGVMDTVTPNFKSQQIDWNRL